MRRLLVQNIPGGRSKTTRTLGDFMESKIMDSIPVDSDFFFVLSFCHVDQFTFHILLPSLKFTIFIHLSMYIVIKFTSEWVKHDWKWENTDLSWQCAQPENWRSPCYKKFSFKMTTLHQLKRLHRNLSELAKANQFVFLISLCCGSVSMHAMGDGRNIGKSFCSFLSIKT